MAPGATPLEGLRSDLEALRRRLAERESRFESHSMELLRCVLENAPDYVGMLAPDGTILFMNRVRAGAVIESVLGTSVYDYQAPADREAYRACIESVVRTGRPDAIDSEAHLSDGRVVRFETRFGPVREGDQVIAVTIIATDVTANRQAMQALRESQAKLRMAVDASGIGLWSWDTRTDHVVWEDTLCAIFGLPPGAAPIGREGFLALVHPDDRQHRVADRIARGVATGEWEGEYRIVRADGAVRWVVATGTVVHERERERRPRAVVDVTERRQRDEQQRQAQKLEAVGQLTAGIAHNFNNMLMGILPNIELAAQAAPRELLPLLRSAEHSALRAADLVRQLMTYAGRNRPTARTIESIGCARGARGRDLPHDLRPAHRARGPLRRVRARARVDAAQLEQALLNVLINARDALEGARDRSAARPRRGRRRAGQRRGARPGWRAGATWTTCAFASPTTGSGWMRPRWRASTSRSSRPRTSGRERGSASPPRTRSCASTAASIDCAVGAPGGDDLLDLPPGQRPARCRRAQADVRAAHRRMAPRRCSSSTTSRPIRNVVSQMLREAGYTAHVAASGQDALALLARGAPWRRRYALVLLDVSMPGMPARELRSRLREIVPRARVVYFTGYAFEAADADDTVLQKPLTQTELLKAIRAALDRRSPAG